MHTTVHKQRKTKDGKYVAHKKDRTAQPTVKNICFWTKFNKTGHGLAGQDKQEVVTSARTVSLKGVPINLKFFPNKLENETCFR